MSELLSIIVPVYNEEATVGAVIERLLAIELPVAREILVVNDGSTDGTRARARCAADRGDRLRIVHAPANGGKGRAIRTGFEQARGTIVAIQDADLELDPAELGVAGAADPGGRDAGGLRLAVPARRLRGAPWLTVAANRFLTGLTNVLYGSRLTDMETCYKVMRTEVARAFAARGEPLRHRAGDHRQAAARRASASSNCRCASSREAARRARRSAGATASRPLSCSPGIGFADVAALAAALGRRGGGRRVWRHSGVVEGTWAVGGSDSSCYALDGRRVCAGEVQPLPDLWRSRRPGPTRRGRLRRPASSRRPSAPARRRQSARRASRCCSRRSLAGRTDGHLSRDAALPARLLVWLTFIFGRRLAGRSPAPRPP